MAVSFYRGQQLGRDGLNIFLTGSNGTPSNAAEISYALFDFTTGREALLGSPRRQPANPSVGEYYASVIIPLDANLGAYRVRWTFRELVGGPVQQVLQEFVVADKSVVATAPEFTQIEQDCIRRLRVLLRDSNPARDYHFRPPAHEETVSQFNRVFGYIWQDEELNEFIESALNDIIAAPPRTPFANIDSMVSYRREWTTVLLTGAMWYALHALQINWVADEFAYSVGGVSLDLEKSSKYESAASATAEQFDKKLEKAKACVNVIKGLQQPKYGTGIRSSFGPFSVLGSTQVRVFLPDDSAVDIAIEDLFVTDRPEIRVPLDARQLRVCAVASTGDVGLHIVDKVVQHATFHKSLVRTVLDDGRAVTTTLDHSLFHRVDEAVLPLEAGSLRGGDKIVTVDGGSVAEVTVASVLLLPPVEYTYDLSVPGPESFVLTCGILSHNSGRGVLSPRKFVGL